MSRHKQSTISSRRPRKKKVFLIRRVTLGVSGTELNVADFEKWVMRLRWKAPINFQCVIEITEHYKEWAKNLINEAKKKEDTGAGTSRGDKASSEDV